MTNEEIIERRVALEIINIINQICFSDEYREYRIRWGTRGQKDLILQTIEERYLR